MFTIVLSAALFFLLTPGILLSLPKGGSKKVVAATHAIVFVLLWGLIHKGCLSVFNEPFQGALPTAPPSGKPCTMSWFSNPCKSGEFCHQPPNTKGMCIPIPTKKLNEPCKYDLDCLTSLCGSEGVCKVRHMGPCTGDKPGKKPDCGEKGDVCDARIGKCLYLPGMPCRGVVDCVSGKCDTQTKKCL